MKSNVGALGAMNKCVIPFNVETMQTNSLRLKQLFLMLTDYFATDTTSFDADTAALEKIWENKADFKDKIDALTANDTSQFKQAIGQVFKSCKGCHDNYKKD